MTTNARDAGYTMPAEWAPHERCWMAWPCDSHWDSGPGLDTIRGVFTDVARAIRHKFHRQAPSWLPGTALKR